MTEIYTHKKVMERLEKNSSFVLFNGERFSILCRQKFGIKIKREDLIKHRVSAIKHSEKNSLALVKIQSQETNAQKTEHFYTYEHPRGCGLAWTCLLGSTLLELWPKQSVKI